MDSWYAGTTTHKARVVLGMSLLGRKSRLLPYLTHPQVYTTHTQKLRKHISSALFETRISLGVSKLRVSSILQ